MSTTPNMLLLLPIPTITPGPTYASEEVTAFTVIDAHDHTTGKGVPVPTLGLNINNDLTFNGYNAIDLRSTRYAIQTAVLSAPTDLACIYSVNGNLYWNNQLGQPVQITSGAAIDATTIGGIGGDYATSTALLFYTSADRTFTFWSNTNVPANIDAGSVTIRQVTTSPNGITINSPSALAASYGVTLPGALPSVTSVLTEDPTGQIGYAGVGSINPSGSVLMYGGVSAPAGYLLCDGTSYLQTAYPTLYAAIGTAFGSADGTHFNVPDMRGNFPRGANGAANGYDPDYASRTAAATGGNTGNNVGSLQGNQIQNHSHSLAISNTAGGNISGVAGSVSASPPVYTPPNAIQSSNGGVGSGNQTNPINLYFNFIIKT